MRAKLTGIAPSPQKHDEAESAPAARENAGSSPLEVTLGHEAVIRVPTFARNARTCPLRGREALAQIVALVLGEAEGGGEAIRVLSRQTDMKRAGGAPRDP